MKKPSLKYTMTGVATDASTVLNVHCTSLEKVNSVEVGLEVFSETGAPLNDASAGNGNVVILPGGTRTIVANDAGTGSAFFFENEFVNLAGDPSQGSARIIATSSKILCTASLTSLTGNPPALLMDLHLFKGKSQKGD
jgi:hypothetical protein